MTGKSSASGAPLSFAGPLPGLIYPIWRLNSRHVACPTCHQAGMIPANSPRALDLKRKMPEQPSPVIHRRQGHRPSYGSCS